MVNNTALGHFGRLEIESTLGSGTSVRLLLPRPEKELAPTEIRAWPEILNSDLRILVVDDDEFVLNAHAAILRHLGLEPQTSSRALEALFDLDAEKFEIVITDLRMPEISSIEFSQRVRAMCPTTRIFPLTAFEGGLEDAP